MQTGDSATIQARVTAGAVYLESSGYARWYDLVDPDTLNMSNCRADVMGQLMGHYCEWLLTQVKAGNLTLGWERGFIGCCLSDDIGLTAEWRRVIQERRHLNGRVQAHPVRGLHRMSSRARRRFQVS